jgi:hypothetical protein
VTFSLSLPNNTIQAYKGVKLTLTAATSQAGKITFYADGKKIPGCISLVTSIGNKTCDWKPASRRNVTITATYTPTSILYLSAVAQINVGVSQRSTFR